MPPLSRLCGNESRAAAGQVLLRKFSVFADSDGVIRARGTCTCTCTTRRSDLSVANRPHGGWGAREESLCRPCWGLALWGYFGIPWLTPRGYPMPPLSRLCGNESHGAAGRLLLRRFSVFADSRRGDSCTWHVHVHVHDET